MSEKSSLAREQLDRTLSTYVSLRNSAIPPKGWIRALRDALGMSGRQLAERLGVARQRVAKIEKDEREGSVTLKTMRRVAESLDSTFVYTFVPRTSLEEIVQDQAKRIAKERISRVSHSMLLEDQALPQDEEDQVMAELINQLVASPPRNFWDL